MKKRLTELERAERWQRAQARKTPTTGRPVPWSKLEALFEPPKPKKERESSKRQRS
ncbi:MAG: hypothetical protein JNM17_15015 [Archangium sp.]|nr:hypothetical protein [Archangium sp.]